MDNLTSISQNTFDGGRQILVIVLIAERKIVGELFINIDIVEIVMQEVSPFF